MATAGKPTYGVGCVLIDLACAHAPSIPKTRLPSQIIQHGGCGPSCVGAANPAAPSPHLRLTGSTLSDMSALRNKDKYLSSPPTE